MNGAKGKQTFVWWQDHAELADLARFMLEEMCVGAETVIEMLEKPWKWNDEHAEMLAARKARVGTT